MMQKTSVRILVLGAQEVGKSAVTVRFLTQRFIGEYSSQKDLLYCSQAHVSGCPVDVEILDTSRDQTDSISSEKLDWSSAFAVVYSVASRPSFLVAADCLRSLRHRDRPLLLIANKSDLEHAREVAPREGRALADEFRCVAFAEVSAAEGHQEVSRAFETLLGEARGGGAVKRKMSVASVSRIISAVFGSHGHQQQQKKRPSLSL